MYQMKARTNLCHKQFQDRSPLRLPLLSDECVEAVNSPDVVERLAADGSTPLTSTPAQFKSHISSEISKWRRLVKDAGLQMN